MDLVYVSHKGYILSNVFFWMIQIDMWILGIRISVRTRLVFPIPQ